MIMGLILEHNYGPGGYQEYDYGPGGVYGDFGPWSYEKPDDGHGYYEKHEASLREGVKKLDFLWNMSPKL